MEYIRVAAELICNSLIILFGKADSLLSGYVSLLLLHAALYLIVSIRHHEKPKIAGFLYDAASAFLIIAVANVTGNAVRLQPLRFLAFAYYILHEADCIFSLLESENHATPPKVSDLIGRKAAKQKKTKKSGSGENNLPKSR